MTDRIPLFNSSGLLTMMGATDTVGLAHGGTGSTTAAGARTNLAQVEWVTAARSYYVRTDGNDSNDGSANTSGAAWLTIQKALDVVSTLGIAGGITVTINIADGTYATTQLVKPWTGGGSVKLLGNTTTPANVAVGTTTAHCFSLTGPLPGKFTIFGMKMTATGFYCIDVVYHGILELSNVDFGVADRHINILAAAKFNILTNYTISGSATFHIVASAYAYIDIRNITVTLSGTPAFTYFLYCVALATVIYFTNTISGSATGTKFYVFAEGLLDIRGTSLPGSIAGVIDASGIFVGASQSTNGYQTFGNASATITMTSALDNSLINTVAANATRVLTLATTDVISGTKATFATLASASVWTYTNGGPGGGNLVSRAFTGGGTVMAVFDGTNWKLLLALG